MVKRRFCKADIVGSNPIEGSILGLNSKEKTCDNKSCDQDNNLVKQIISELI